MLIFDIPPKPSGPISEDEVREYITSKIGNYTTDEDIEKLREHNRKHK